MECKNCATPISKNEKFCFNCGAKVISNRLTMRYLMSEIRDGFFNLDSSKPVKTFVHLFTKPAEVIGGYIDGTRKKYINAFGYFTIAITLSSFYFFIVLKFFPESINYMAEIQSAGKPEAIEAQKELSTVIFENNSLLFFLFIPITAILSRLVFLKNKKYNFAEHLVINLYGYSQISILSILIYFTVVWSPKFYTIASFLVMPFQILYFAYILKKLYQLSLGQIILKTLLFLVLLIPTFIIICIAVFILMLSSGMINFQEMIEAEKARQEISYMASSIMNWTS